MGKFFGRITKQPMGLGAVTLMTLVFGIGFYKMALSPGGSITAAKPAAITAAPEATSSTPVVTERKIPTVHVDEEGRKQTQRLPSIAEAEHQQKQHLTHEGRYASPLDDPPPAVVVRQTPIVADVQKNRSAQAQSRKHPLEDDVAALWARFNRIDARQGGLMDASKPENVFVKPVSSGPASPVEGIEGLGGIPYYTFVKAMITTTADNLNTEMPVMAEVCDPRFPDGTQLIGRSRPNMDAYRLYVEFDKLKLPGEEPPRRVKALAYSIDESPGIASKVERRDVTGAVISTVLAGARGFFEAFTKDTSTTVISLSGGTIGGETKLADNRLREGLVNAGEQGAGKIEGMVDRELEKDAYKTVVMAEKGLPIIVLFTQ